MALRFKSDLENSGFIKGIRGMESAADKFSAKFKNIGSALTAGLVGGGAIVGMRSIVEGFSRINDAAAGLSLNPEEFQRLSFAFEQSGAKQEDFVKGFSALTQKLEDARQKGGEVSAVFKELGISQEQIDTEGTTKHLFRIADALKSSGGGTREFAAAIDIIGSKLGVKFIPGLVQGSEELKRLGSEAKIASQDVIEAADAMGDAANKFSTERRNMLGANLFGIGENMKAGAAARRKEFGDNIMSGFAGGAAGFLDSIFGGSKFLEELPNVAPAFKPSDAETIRAKQSAEAVARRASVEERTAKEMEGFQKSQIVHEKMLGEAQEKADTANQKRQDQINKSYEDAFDIRRETYLDSLDSEERIKELERDRLNLQLRMAGEVSDLESAALDEDLALIEERLAKEKAITAEKSIRSSMSEDGGRLPPALTRRDRVAERHAEAQAGLAERVIGGSALNDMRDEYARAREDFKGAFGKGRRAPNGKQMLGPWPDEPPRRGMGEREQELGRRNEVRARIDPEDMDKMADKFITKLEAKVP